MSFPLPPTGHKARELLGDMSTLAEQLNPANVAKLPVQLTARRLATEAFARDTTQAIKRICFIVLRGDDERWLVSFGRRGGWRKEWNFGTGRDHARA